MLSFRNILVTAFLLGAAVSGFGANEPGLSQLSKSGAIMAPGSASYEVSDRWMDTVRFMAKVEVYDSIADRMVDLLCGTDQNKSILLIGEPDETYRYVFARVAARTSQKNCNRMWHVEVDINKIEAGHKYVGQVDEYWEESVLKPADGKDVVLYFRNIAHLIGIGSHSNDETGVESEYVANVLAGRIRAVSFINKYEFNRLRASQHGYVIEAHAEKIRLESLVEEKVKDMVRKYIEVLAPDVTLTQFNLNYLYRNSEYYQPNISEPQRTLSILKAALRNVADNSVIETEVENIFETPHPYEANSNLFKEIKMDGFDGIRLKFQSFRTENIHDKLEISDGNTDYVLENLTGNLGAFVTKTYPTNHLILNFISDGSGNLDGFKMVSAIGITQKKIEVSTHQIREALFEVVQVPRWILNRDYTIVSELQGKLEGDVVGVEQGKKDMVRLAKLGYVAGRTDEKPVASTLLVGPTGTGKSYIAKKMAEFMNMKLITFDMTQYATAGSFDRFLDIVSQSLVVNPFAFYLFEEIDKANVAVLDRLYFLLDEGVFYDRHQRPIFARGAFIMMTTNAAKDLIIRERDNPNLKQMVDEELQRMFRASFLNRFDATTIFLPFTDAEFYRLAEIMVSKKISKLSKYFAWNLSVDQATVNYLSVNGRSAVYGARPMERLIENVISMGIAEYQLTQGLIEFGDHMSLSKATGSDEFVFEVEGKGAVTFTVDRRNNDGSMFNIFLNLL